MTTDLGRSHILSMHVGVVDDPTDVSTYCRHLALFVMASQVSAHYCPRAIIYSSFIAAIYAPASSFPAYRSRNIALILAQSLHFTLIHARSREYFFPGIHKIA